jgi:hypothetical protein
MIPLEKVGGILAQRERKLKPRLVEIFAKQFRKIWTPGELS